MNWIWINVQFIKFDPPTPLDCVMLKLAKTRKKKYESCLGNGVPMTIAQMNLPWAMFFIAHIVHRPDNSSNFWLICFKGNLIQSRCMWSII